MSDGVWARERELGRLREFSRRLLDARDRAELFVDAVRIAAELMAAEVAAIAVPPGDGAGLEIVAATGALAEFRGRLVPIEGSLLGAAVSEGNGLVSNRFTLDSRNHRISGVAAEYERAAAVPLRARGELVGSLGVYAAATRDPFHLDDLALLGLVAELVAVGLERLALIDDTRQGDRALEQTNRELVETVAVRSQLLTQMSHEFRTPLNAIIGFAELLETDPEAREADRDYLRSIARNGRHLLEVATSFLDAAKLQAGRLALRRSRFDLRAVVEAAVRDTASLRARKNHRCTVELDPAPLDLTADEQKLRQVLYNLLANAAKFTDAGGTVTVIATRLPMPLPGPDGRPTVRDAIWLAVRDTGVGIAGEDLPKLFRAFSQLDHGARQQGTGLGLMLCKQFVELHGGMIGVDSVPGYGSAFWVAVPVDGPEPGPETMLREPPSQAGRSVMGYM